MAETAASGDLIFVSEVSVEGNVSDKVILSTLRKLSLGTHQTVSEAFREKAKDCIIVGKIVEVKDASSLNNVQKVIIREATPEGFDGCIFALFALGEVSKHLKQFSLKVDDMLVIHQPSISKSCLINFLNLQSHAYEYQIVANYSKMKEKSPPRLFIQLMRPKVPDVFETVKKQNSKNSTLGETSLPERKDSTKSSTTNTKRPEKAVRKTKKLMNVDEYIQLKPSPVLMEVPPRHWYTRLGEITPSCTKVNIIGVIISVQKGCPCMEKKEHLLIYLQDECSHGKNFVLNVGSCKTELPPLHKTYILRALNVMILCENDEVTGWVTSGKVLATVDSDSEKPIAILTVQENCTLTEEDEDRISELQNFVKTSVSLDNLQIHSDERCDTPLSENHSQDCQSVSTKAREENLVKLHPDHSQHSSQLNSDSFSSEDILKLHLDSSPEPLQSDTESLTSKDTIYLEHDVIVPVNGTDTKHDQESEVRYCPSEEMTDCGESASLPIPDVGTDADVMQAMWNFVMRC